MFKYNHSDESGTGTVTCEVDAVGDDGKPFKQSEIVARVYPGDDGKSPRIDFCCVLKVNSAKAIADVVQNGWKPEVPVVRVLTEVDRLKAKLSAAGIDPEK